MCMCMREGEGERERGRERSREDTSLLVSWENSILEAGLSEHSRLVKESHPVSKSCDTHMTDM